MTSEPVTARLAGLAVLALTIVVGLGVVAVRATAPPTDEATGSIMAALAEPDRTPGQGGAPGQASGTGPDGVYRVPGNLCQEADFTALRPTFTTLTDLGSTGDTSAGYVAVARCDGATGNDLVQGAFSFQASVYVQAALARAEFELVRAEVEARTGKPSLPGADDRVYHDVGPDTATTVEVFDGNLRLRLSWISSNRTSPPPDGTAAALLATCRSTMRLLREN